MFHKYQPDSQKFSAFYGSLKHILEQQFRMVYYYTSLIRRFIITRMCLKHDEHSVLFNKCNILRGDQIGLFKLVTLNCILNCITGVTFGY
jgi:hypothetical protein